MNSSASTPEDTSPESIEEKLKAARRVLDRVGKLPVLDDRRPDEILGYDENGLP
jgi:hypothetical protein